jgi:hypothetical protein
MASKSGSKHKRRRELLAMAEQLGCGCEIEQSGGDHMRVTLTHKGRTRKLFASLSPGDRRSDMNFRSDMRRAVRELRDGG